MYQISRNASVSIYYQVMTDIKNRIISEEWITGDRIPTEMELSEYYGISRTTLRQALAELEKDGILVKKGKGLFVNDRKSPFLIRLDYYSLNYKNIFTSVVIDQLKTKCPSDYIARALGIKPDDEVVYISRLYSKDGTPIALSKAYIPADLVPGLENKALFQNSLSKTLRKLYNIEPRHVSDRIQAVRASLSECQLLSSSPDTPLMLIEGRTYIRERALEYSRTVWIGDAMQFEFFMESRDHKLVFTTNPKNRIGDAKWQN